MTAIEPDLIDHESLWECREGELLLPGYLAWQRLGTGARNETWLAWSVRQWAPVVVRLARPGGKAHCDRAGAAIAREAHAAAGARHPAMPRLLVDGRRAAVPYLVYEYVEGTPLSTLVREAGPLGAVDTVAFVAQVASAVRSLHDRGFAHLGIKPDNVLIRDGRAVLVSLGSACPLGSRPFAGGIGMAGYAAPELEAGAPVTPAMDLYSIGVLMRRVLAGRPVFEPDALAARRPDRPSLVAAVPAEVVSINTRLLAPRPADRPDIVAVLQELHAVAASLCRDSITWPEWANRWLAEPRRAVASVAAG